MAVTIPSAIDVLCGRLPDALTVSTCGYLSRDLLANGDRDENFYLVGSMGMAAPIGVGVGIAHPKRTILVIDGDGSFVMNLSALPVVADSGANIIHAVLDNGAHASTGGQRTVAVPDVAGLAVAAGYRSAVHVAFLTELRAVDLPLTGAHLLHIACEPRGYPIGPRLAITPQELVARFRAHIARVSQEEALS